MVHTTVTPKNKLVSFEIPDNYIGKQIEIIAFANDEGMAMGSPKDKIVTFNALSLDTRGYKFNRDEANER